MILSEPYRYPIHSWLLTVGIIFPVLLTTYQAVVDTLDPGTLGVSLVIVPYAFPVFAVVFLVYWLLIRMNWPVWILKLILNMVGIAGVFITMYAINRRAIINYVTILMSISILLSSLFIKWRKEVNPS